MGLEEYCTGLESISKHIDAVMFKTSGWGEITRLPNYTELFQTASKLNYQVFQLITNGIHIFSSNELKEFQDLGYFSLQISLDGLTDYENIYRFHGRNDLLDRVLYNMELALRNRIPLEINTVLTDVNTDRLTSFFKELLRLKYRHGTPIICVPRWVRVKKTLNNKTHLPTIEMVDRFEEEAIGRYSDYSEILPPKAYLEGLVYQMRTGKRNWKTYDSLIRVNIGASGDIVIHEGSGNSDLGTIYGDNINDAIYQRLLRHSFSGDIDYQAKITQFDIHYLYLSGAITYSDLQKVPSCNNPVSEKRLKYLRKQVKQFM